MSQSRITEDHPQEGVLPTPSDAMRRSASIYENLIETRRWLHAHAELAFQEHETASFLLDRLSSLNLPTNYHGLGHSVTADLVTDPGKPFVALRAEMDALPGREMTGAPYASEHTDTMHACGHAAHMTMVLGAAEILKKHPPPGNVRFIFQPAEEAGGGARVAISDGALNDVTAIYAGHVTHDYAPGTIMVRNGTMTSQSDRFLINIEGKSGHAARPHEATDAIVVASMLINAIQTLVSRETNPLHPTVVTVGRIAAGTAANVVAGEAELEGSIRTTLPEVRDHIHLGLRRVAEAASILHDAKVDIEIVEGYPPVINSIRETEIARTAVRNILGEQNLADSDHPSMGSEDFSFYLLHVPGCFVRFGARPAGWEPIPLHNPAFDIDEKVLQIGTAFFDEVARSHMASLG